MHSRNSDESLSISSRGDDRFFLIATVFLPIFAQLAYIFDVYYYHYNGITSNGYEGLLSSILSVFAYLQYCVPIHSRLFRFIYHLFLWILSQIGTLGHLISYSKRDDTFHAILYSIWAVVDSFYFGCLIYCRVFPNTRHLRIHMAIEQRHLFHFISRLEVILAIFIPVFFDTRLITLTKDNIAFYILFDFFAEYYHRFHGVTIKATLYIFVITVTASVATEWIHIAKHEMKYEIASLACELLAACLCYSLIVMQFFPNNFISRRQWGKYKRRQTVSSISSHHNRHSLDTSTENNVCYF
ncbi:unnamed protein product [Adineta steineri]|uniref:Uncharacterized protein n=1 Tax=Adineta steineri TaxID=433720 RepID=A0A818ISI3_9BILA|nr:unnamed protein product [Adineta steineri]CAF1218677.1 unnamed protein product [Adineta steineri]CAF3532104.1 unnamed protein product [Adineta steineri]CAF3792813.1 unnamed protein product [Adineta steineri]